MKKALILLLFISLSSLICFSQDIPDGCKPPSSTPGNDNPDESFAVGNSLAGTIPSYFDALPFVGIFFKGYHGSTDALLTRLKRGCFYVKEEFDSTAVLDRVKVLMIPTGALYGMENSEVRFEAHFTNRSQQDKSLRLWQDLTRREAEYWGEVVIPAEGSSTVEITLQSSEDNYSHEFCWLHIFEENGEGIYSSLRDNFYKLPYEEPWTYVGSATKGFRVINPSFEIKVQADKKVYRRGETVNTVLTLENLTGLPLDTTINLRVKNSLDEFIYEYSFVRHFEANVK